MLLRIGHFYRPVKIRTWIMTKNIEIENAPIALMIKATLLAIS